MIRLLLVDDHRLVRSGLRRVLEDTPGLEVVGEASSGEEAIELARDEKPDVILMDVNMPGIGGLEATRRILQRDDAIKVIAVSMHLEEPYPSRMLSVGASGYLSKDAAAEEVVTAIKKVHAGGNYLEQEVAGNIAMAMAKGRGDEKSPFERLSQREMQVMLMVTAGHSPIQISEQLNLSPKTVSTYRSRVFEKLEVANDVELTRMAMRYGVLDDEQMQSGE